jgi:YVTN family beta-propeller protein
VGRRSVAVRHNPRDNKVYCANLWSNDVTVIDGRTNLVDTTIAVGLTPVGLACNPDQIRVYVGNSQSSSVSVLRDNEAGMEQSPGQLACDPEPLPTVVRGVLQVSLQPTANGLQQDIRLLDATGRKVLDLHPGPNDVRALAPGVYFVRAEPSAVSRQPSAVTKVVLAR